MTARQEKDHHGEQQQADPFNQEKEKGPERQDPHATQEQGHRHNHRDDCYQHPVQRGYERIHPRAQENHHRGHCDGAAQQ